MPISAIEHYSYCPRQCALIHVDQTYEENAYTIRGRFAHERIEAETITTRPGVQVLRGLPLWSDRLGLRGKADVVELRPDGPYPIEYKAGPRRGRHADLQLCAQALCLEEMLGVQVVRGAVFHRASARRYEVTIDEALREEALLAVTAIRHILRSQRLPEAPNDQRCPKCSLREACLPNVVAESQRLRRLQGALFQPY